MPHNTQKSCKVQRFPKIYQNNHAKYRVFIKSNKIHNILIIHGKMSTHLINLRQNTKIQNTIFIFLNYKMVEKYIFPSYLTLKHLIGC